MRLALIFFASLLCILLARPAIATVTSFSFCRGAITCDVTDQPPQPTVKGSYAGVLLAWDEAQNHTLAAALRVDRVFDPSAGFINDLGGGAYEIAAGTIVSSHYLQWMPGGPGALGAPGGQGQVTATLNADNEILAFITSLENLEASNAVLGLAGLGHDTSALQSMGPEDITAVDGLNVDLSWQASTSGEWARVVTGFSPAFAFEPPTVLLPVADVPLPPAIVSLLGLVPVLVALTMRKTRRRG